MESLAPAATEVEEDVASAERDAAEGPKMVEPAPEIPSGEPILPPPPASTILPIGRLILAGEVTGTRQQQPTSENQDAAGTYSGNLLVSPSGWQHVIPTELIDDLMLTAEVLKNFQDTFKELYKFSTVCLLVY
jgi:hypothetical protein